MLDVSLQQRDSESTQSLTQAPHDITPMAVTDSASSTETRERLTGVPLAKELKMSMSTPSDLQVKRFQASDKTAVVEEHDAPPKDMFTSRSPLLTLYAGYGDDGQGEDTYVTMDHQALLIASSSRADETESMKEPAGEVKRALNNEQCRNPQTHHPDADISRQRSANIHYAQHLEGQHIQNDQGLLVGGRFGPQCGGTNESREVMNISSASEALTMNTCASDPRATHRTIKEHHDHIPTRVTLTSANGEMTNANDKVNNSYSMHYEQALDVTSTFREQTTEHVESEQMSVAQSLTERVTQTSSEVEMQSHTSDTQKTVTYSTHDESYHERSLINGEKARVSTEQQQLKEQNETTECSTLRISTAGGHNDLVFSPSLKLSSDNGNNKQVEMSNTTTEQMQMPTETDIDMVHTNIPHHD